MVYNHHRVYVYICICIYRIKYLRMERVNLLYLSLSAARAIGGEKGDGPVGTYVCTDICVCVCVCVYVCIYIYIYRIKDLRLEQSAKKKETDRCVYMYVQIYIYVCVCVYICVCMYIYI